MISLLYFIYNVAYFTSVFSIIFLRKYNINLKYIKFGLTHIQFNN